MGRDSFNKTAEMPSGPMSPIIFKDLLRLNRLDLSTARASGPARVAGRRPAPTHTGRRSAPTHARRRPAPTKRESIRAATD